MKTVLYFNNEAMEMTNIPSSMQDAHTKAHIHMDAHAHMHTHACMHILTHVHARTHTQSTHELIDTPTFFAVTLNMHSRHTPLNTASACFRVSAI